MSKKLLLRKLCSIILQTGADFLVAQKPLCGHTHLGFPMLLPEEFSYKTTQLCLRSAWQRTQIFVWLAPVNNLWVLPHLLYKTLPKLSEIVWVCVQCCLLWLKIDRLVKTWFRREPGGRDSVFSCVVWTFSSWARSSGHQDMEGLLSWVSWGKWAVLLIKISVLLPEIGKKSLFLIAVAQNPFRCCSVGVPEVKHWGWGMKYLGSQTSFFPVTDVGLWCWMLWSR